MKDSYVGAVALARLVQLVTAHERVRLCQVARSIRVSGDGLQRRTPDGFWFPHSVRLPQNVSKPRPPGPTPRTTISVIAQQLSEFDFPNFYSTYSGCTRASL